MKILKYFSIVILFLIIAVVGISFIYFRQYLARYEFWRPSLAVEKFKASTDFDSDGIDDQTDLYLGALAQIGKVTKYEDGYYADGYPPENLGVCSDVLWRAFNAVGLNFKDLVDADILENLAKYPRVENDPDPKIDFRRVANLEVFFLRKAQNLTLAIKPWDASSLYQWQAGDIVIWDKLPGSGKMHIGVLSEKRRADGVPYVIHNYCCGVLENDMLLLWPSGLIGHYRFFN